ncbi:MAG: BREX system P-loop protein BrxC [Deltaproteobacteria bacterium]|nr:MAG: BREX system P-loop protein BrxC [Deltaproteobacteria bacterium]
MTTPTTPLRDLFVSDVTRDIPPVVYFHEQSPEKLADEVGEYIITGGWRDGHPNHQRVPNGIHEQYVRLLGAIADAIDRSGGADLPASWISGFYGSGKSSFAKLLGLALDGVALPDGRRLADALLARDASQKADELRTAWTRLAGLVDPLAVVFDIGGTARDGEPIHSAVLRQVQRRLGYCKDAWVAEYELRLERSDEWAAFLAAFEREHGRPWADVKDREFAEDEFSAGLHRWRPDLYAEPHAWVDTRSGTYAANASPSEVTRAIEHMLDHRAPGKTLFIVVDEVSQYIHQDHGRMLTLQSFVSELGQRLKGRVWLLVTGQERLDQAGNRVVLGKMKDRFPPRLRVHLAATNIRDVVHRRLLDKSQPGRATLEPLLDAHRNDLRLFAYGCEEVTREELVETYPLLPGHIDLLLEITSALRVRSARSQGDDQAIRGLLQLLGELFRERRLADAPLGTLVTLEDVYEIQATALDTDAQNTMAKVLEHCARPGADHDLARSCAKAVALLQLIQEDKPTTANLVARCLYDRLDRGDREADVASALESLRDANLLGYSEKDGYKLQSAAGEEWERERRATSVTADDRGDLVMEALDLLVADPDNPRYQGRRFPWHALYSDHRPIEKALKRSADPACVTVDLRWVRQAERDPAEWTRRSAQDAHHDALLWVAGHHAELDELASELHRSRAMVRRYEPRKSSLPRDRQMLLLGEQGRSEDLTARLRRAVDQAFCAGSIYFRGQVLAPASLGAAFIPALSAVGERVLPDLFPHLVATNVTDGELQGLLTTELAGVSTKFLTDELGILAIEGGRYVATCTGVVPRRLFVHIQELDGVGGDTLLRHFAGPPYGYLPNVIRACALGLLHGRLVRIVDEARRDLVHVRDAGVRDVFLKDRDFRRASFHPAGEGPVPRRVLAQIAQLFEQELDGGRVDRDDVAIAEAVEGRFHGIVARLRDVEERLNRLRPSPPTPEPLVRLKRAVEDCVRRTRQTEQTVKEVARHLDALRDGVRTLKVYDAELTDDAIDAVRAVHDAWEHRYRQLTALGPLDDDLAAAGGRIERQLTGERPWLGISAVHADADAVTAAYEAVRQRLIDAQTVASEAARERLKARPGYRRLSDDQSNRVLRPLTEALTVTDAHALKPPLVDLADPFRERLRRAEEEAQSHLDAILAELDEKPVVRVKVPLQNRVITSTVDLDATLAEVRERVEAQLAAGKHVRLTIGS